MVAEDVGESGGREVMEVRVGGEVGVGDGEEREGIAVGKISGERGCRRK